MAALYSVLRRGCAPVCIFVILAPPANVMIRECWLFRASGSVECALTTGTCCCVVAFKCDQDWLQYGCNLSGGICYGLLWTVQQGQVSHEHFWIAGGVRSARVQQCCVCTPVSIALGVEACAVHEIANVRISCAHGCMCAPYFFSTSCLHTLTVHLVGCEISAKASCVVAVNHCSFFSQRLN